MIEVEFPAEKASSLTSTGKLSMVVAFCVRVRACASATQPMVAVAAAAAPPSKGLLSNLLGEFPVFRPGHSLSLLSSGRGQANALLPAGRPRRLPRRRG